MTELNSLYDLWVRLLGDPPEADQFIYWMTHFPDEVIRQAINRTAAKNLKAPMDMRHRIAFATAIMRNRLKDARWVNKVKTRLESNPPAQSGSQGEHVL